MNAIPNSSSRERALQTLIDFARGFQDDVAPRRAVAGDGATLDVSGANRRIYVQLGGEGGEIAEAVWDQWKPALGEICFVLKPRALGNYGYLVLGQAAGEDAPCL